MSIETSIAALVEDETGQPYPYRAVELVEPDWTRFPGWKDVTAAEWESVQWQRSHCVKNLKQLREVLGDLVDERFYADLERDQAERATMSMLVPPQMLNTMAPHVAPRGAGSLTDAFYADPVRHYMLPVFSDRRTDWPSHPHATRDSLHEHDMWAVEGLTHRYPTKVLAELLPTCPQYCGHCTRMDLVGNSTPTVEKLKLTGKPNDRLGAMIDYLRRTPSVRDVVVSGGDVANMPWPRLEAFLTELLTVENIRDVRLATKALIGMPQHWLQPEVVEGVHRVATLARSRGVSLAMHTHANHANSVTPLVARGAKAMLDAGLRDVRNQGVLLNGVNADPHALLDLCFRLLDGAQVMPYYFYMCDMIPFSEHWRVSVADAQRLQHHIMGYLPGYATPRIVCDVPFVGKRWVHQLAGYDTERGISHWTKNYRTSIEAGDATRCRRPAATGGSSTAGSTSPPSRRPRWPRPRVVRRRSRPGDLLARDRPVLVVRRQHDGRPRGDVGGGPDPCQQVLERGRGRRAHLQDIGLLPRDRPARLDLGDVLEPGGAVVGLGGVDRPDRDERGERQPDVGVVDRRAVALDQPTLLEPLDALVHRRGRQTGRLPEVGEGHPPVLGQQLEDLAVGGLHGGLTHVRHPRPPRSARQAP